ncbi:MAG: plasmid pRiA4b ORF-3 family protein [Candidatus Aminicenantes bacterium]|nr:plasmid pRiA4b ORF-3 family protein [Candidatus Aminicenantes bacterium]
MNKVGNSALYRYDFGDSWEHDVLLEGIFKREPNIEYPRCLDGKLACPPRRLRKHSRLL